jgi:hypothetical protein
MRLPWRRNGDEENRAELDADRAARKDSEERLAETKQQWREVHHLADELRAHRRSNHFSERIMDALRSDGR